MENQSRAATLTVRLVRSFEYKTFRTLVFHDLDLESINLKTLSDMIRDRIHNTPTLAFLQKVPFDTFKIYAQAHGAKTSNPIINTHDDLNLMLRDYDASLWDLGLRHESEISWFVWDDYQRYRVDPQTKWE